MSHFTCGVCQRGSIDCQCADGAVLYCANCKAAPAFAGWPDCLPCGVAILLIEHPNYPTFARSLGYTEAQLEQLDREFARTEIKLGEVA